MNKKDKGINVTFTLDEPIVAWLDKKVENDDNRSRVARQIFRKVKLEEEKEGQAK